MLQFAELPFEAQLAIIVPGVLLFALAIHHLWRVYKLLQMFAHDKKIRNSTVIDTVLPDADFQIPDTLQDYDILARQLGYLPFAAMSKNYISAGNPPVIFYLYRSEDRNTILRFPKQGEKVEFRVSLTTWFENDSVITSGFRSRHNIETERFIQRAYCNSLHEMHHEHQKTVALWVAEGRTPKNILTMESYIEQQAYFRTHYDPLYPLDIQRLARNLILGKLALIAATLCLISTFVLSSLQSSTFILLVYIGAVLLHEKLRKDYVRWFDKPCKPAAS